MRDYEQVLERVAAGTACWLDRETRGAISEALAEIRGLRKSVGRMGRKANSHRRALRELNKGIRRHKYTIRRLTTERDQCKRGEGSGFVIQQLRSERDTLRAALEAHHSGLEPHHLANGTVYIHRAEVCEAPCPVHHPTDHHMRPWPLLYRSDRGLFERVCAHGVGHPDPDSVAWLRHHTGDACLDVHGCDGCCVQPRAA